MVGMGVCHPVPPSRRDLLFSYREQSQQIASCCRGSFSVCLTCRQQSHTRSCSSWGHPHLMSEQSRGVKSFSLSGLLQDNSDEQYSLQSPLPGWLAGSMSDLHCSLTLPSIQSCFLPLVNILHLKLCFSICFPKTPTCDGQPHSVTSNWGIFSIFCLVYGNSLLLIGLLVFHFSEFCFILYITIFFKHWFDHIIVLFYKFPIVTELHSESSKWHLRICTTWLHPNFQILFLTTSFCPALP